MFLVVFSLLLVSTGIAPSDAVTGTISGTVLDESGHPLIGAAVMIEGTSMGGMTDSQGQVILADIPVGTYAVRASFVGYRPVVLTDVVVRSARSTSVRFDLTISPAGGATITVRPDYFSEDAGEPTSSTEMSGEQVRRAPGSAGDVIRVVTSLPSVAKFDDQYNGLAVRGGNPSETGFYIDGIETSNINHFPRQGTTGGGLSLVNVDLLRSADFSAGGFAPEYGGRLSSVMSLETREGCREEFDAQVDFGLAGIGCVVEGPAGSAGSWLACARHSWVDLLVDIAEIDAVPTYSDYQAKLVLDVGGMDRLAFMSVGAFDHVDYSLEQAESDGNYNYGVTENTGLLAGLTWRRLWGAGLSTTSISIQDIAYRGDYHVTSTGAVQAMQDSEERDVRLRNVSSLELGASTLVLGADVRLGLDEFDNYYAPDTNQSGDPMPALEVEGHRRSIDLGLSSRVTFHLTEALSATVGARLDRFGGTDGLHLSPRGSFEWRLPDDFTAGLSAGAYVQPLPDELLARDEGYSAMGDPSAFHVVARLSRLLGDDTRLGIEAYSKDYDGLPYDPTQPEYAILDGLDSEQDLYAFDTLATGGDARSRGIEIMLEKKLVSGVYGLVAGSIGSSEYMNPGQPWRRRIFDNGCTFTVEGGYRLDERWEFSARFVWAGGRPYTPLDIAASAASGRTILDSTRVNAERLPAYHSLNIRVDRRFNFSGSNLTAYASVWNVYDRRNISAVYWNSIEDRPDQILQWGIMPVIGLEYEF